MPAPDSLSVPQVGSLPSWHPDAAVLDLIELVLDGALARLPDGVARPVSMPGPTIVEDAEGTPVAEFAEDGNLVGRRPFSHPPLRSHRLSPAQVRERLADRGAVDQVLAAAVTSPMTTDDVARLGRHVTDARRDGHPVRLLWLVPVGAGRAAPGELPPQAVLRAVRTIAAEVADEAGGRPLVVPVGLPAGYDHLVEEVARAYGAQGVLVATGPEGASDAGLHPAFAAELARMAVPDHRRGLVVFFTGLSGSGKSTVAKALAERVLDAGVRTVSLLDGDEVRRLLSAGLGFSAADREANIARIGFVAAEVARHGGLAIAAPIAPFARGRAEVRERVLQAGGRFVLVHVATPLAECERRDRKGLYAKARAGEIGEFTGISSPYEEPTDADLVIDTTGRDLAECVDQVWQLLAEQSRLDPGHSDREEATAAGGREAIETRSG